MRIATYVTNFFFALPIKKKLDKNVKKPAHAANKKVDWNPELSANQPPRRGATSVAGAINVLAIPT